MAVRVKRVILTGEEKPVYDITVSEDHEFVANGILVSNCRYLIWALGYGLLGGGVDIVTYEDVLHGSY